MVPGVVERAKKKKKTEGSEWIPARQRCVPAPVLSGRAARSSSNFYFQFPQRIHFPAKTGKLLTSKMRVVFSVTLTSGQTSGRKYFQDVGVCACLLGACLILECLSVDNTNWGVQMLGSCCPSVYLLAVFRSSRSLASGGLSFRDSTPGTT